MRVGVLPGPALIASMGVPVALAAIAVADPSWLEVMWTADGMLLVLALVDLARVRKPAVAVSREAPSVASLSRPVEVRLHVENLTRTRLRVRLNEALFPDARSEELPLQLDLAPRAREARSYRVRPRHRGTERIGDHYVRYPSPLRFWIRQLVLPAESEMRIYPDLQAARHYDLVARQDRSRALGRAARLRGGETEFERLRDYAPDDELRRVDWKATARRRRLTAREYQLEQNQSVMCLLDCGRLMTTEWNGLSALDHALNAVTMLAHVAVRRGDRVGLVAFADRIERFVAPSSGRRAAHAIVRSTHDLFPRMVEPDYEAAVRTLRRRVSSRSLAVLLTHALEEETTDRLRRLVAELIPRHVPLVALLRDEALEQGAHRASRGSELFVQAAALELSASRERVLERMRHQGILVVEVTPSELTSALVARYVEAKARALI